MTPTQAQIEAAEKAIQRGRVYMTIRELAEAALTAAAEMGQEERRVRLNHLAFMEAATIERCAQELAHLRQHEFGEDDQFAIGFNEAIKQAQFRIRALKDKP